jgi:hypothetical protein
MKTNRNEQCPCGSGKKYKNCCQEKRFQDAGRSKQIRWIVSGAIGFFIALTLWWIFQFFTTEHPEMEAYKCDNPQCNQIHYRQVTQP